MTHSWYLSLCEDLGLLTLLQARGEAGHDMLLRTDHLHYLLVALYTHTLCEWQAKRACCELRIDGKMQGIKSGD